MISLLLQGQFALFALILIAIILSLSAHEYGHARMAKHFGDDTAERMGRLTLNPIAHIDVMGLIMVALIGFGYAKPVPTDPRNYRSHWASFWVAAAGPGMNLLLAFLCINLQVAGLAYGLDSLATPGPQVFLQYMAFINLLLMLFNLMPIGLLDGHYLVPYFLSRNNAARYLRWNYQYGNMVLFGLIGLSLLGVPIFSYLMNLAAAISRYLILFS